MMRLIIESHIKFSKTESSMKSYSRMYIVCELKLCLVPQSTYLCVAVAAAAQQASVDAVKLIS